MISKDYIQGFDDALRFVRQELRIKSHLYREQAHNARLRRDEIENLTSAFALFQFEDSLLFRVHTAVLEKLDSIPYPCRVAETEAAEREEARKTFQLRTMEKGGCQTCERER